MPAEQTRSDRKRTAILVVHGMGSQRPLDTARGVVEAIWFEGKNPRTSGKRMWTHPEQRGTDIDLPVITADTKPITADSKPPIPPVDFHELYWAHLMSETRAVAVLLWLFELARRGHRLKPSIRELYWGVVVFLALLVLSVSLLATQFILLFVDEVARVSNRWHKSLPGVDPVKVELLLDVEFRLLGFVSLVTFAVVFLLIAATAFYLRAGRFYLWSALTTAITVFIIIVAWLSQPFIEFLTNAFLPFLVALVAVKITMGRSGVIGLVIAYLVSLAALVVIANSVEILAFFGFSISSAPIVCVGRSCVLPWSITAFGSAIAAWVFVAVYLALYALFLQPYLGDAARYFRNAPANVAVRREIRKEAVDTLEDLHLSGKYDRIVVVAHSLGTVVAYDMLRAYYSRIDRKLPDPGTLGSNLKIVDKNRLNCIEARNRGRAVIAKIQSVVEATQEPSNPAAQRDEDIKAWLVTDFVTMGSPLTHAHYLMCNGETEHELRRDFKRRVREFEFPTCPPMLLKGSGRLTFRSSSDHLQYFHHGGLFGLTRWTNLYFPVSQLLWGDAIGGPVAPIFGRNIVDVPVYRSKLKQASFAQIRDLVLPPNFFAHTKYWALPPGEGSEAPHIRALINAINLADMPDGADRSNQSLTADPDRRRGGA